MLLVAGQIQMCSGLFSGCGVISHIVDLPAAFVSVVIAIEEEAAFRLFLFPDSFWFFH